MTTHTITCDYSALVPEWHALTPFQAAHIKTTPLPDGSHSLTYQSKAGFITLTTPPNLNHETFLRNTKSQITISGVLSDSNHKDEHIPQSKEICEI